MSVGDSAHVRVPVLLDCNRCALPAEKIHSFVPGAWLVRTFGQGEVGQSYDLWRCVAGHVFALALVRI